MNYGGFPNLTNTTGQLYQHGMSANPMFATPYAPTQVQALALHGATALGFQGVQAMPHIPAGQSMYGGGYAAQFTTPAYQRMTQMMNRTYGQQLAETLAATGIGPAGSRTELINMMQSPTGQALAGSIRSSGMLNDYMGGDVGKMYSHIFANRQQHAFRPGMRINPNNQAQMRIADEYGNAFSSAMHTRATTDPVTGQRIPNVDLTGGRPIEQLGAVANAMALLDPSNRGMSDAAYSALATAANKGQGMDSLSPDKLKHVEKDIKRKIDNLADTMSALSDIGDVLGEANNIAVLGQVNDALGGQFFNMSGKARRRFASQMSAAQTVYGVSGADQLSMLGTLGTTIAMASGGVNPVTGRIDSTNAMDHAQKFSQYAMAMAAQTGMTAQDALAHTNVLVGKSATSRAGRMSLLVEAGLRTGQISQNLYDKFHAASMSGDIGATNAIVGQMSGMMGQNLFRSIEDPTRMRVAEHQLQALPAAARDAALSAHSDRILRGPGQEMSLRSIEQSRRTSNQILNNMSAKIGLSGSRLMNNEMADEATYAAYRESIESSGLPATEIQNKLNLLERSYNESGMTGVRRMVTRSRIFKDDVAGMQAAGAVARLDKKAELVGKAFEKHGAAGLFLKEVGALAPGKQTTQAVRDIENLMRTDPAGAQVAMDQLYNSLPKDVKEAVRDPRQSRKAAEMLMSNEFQQSVNRRLEKAREDDPNARWETVAQAAAKERGVSVTSDELELAQSGRNAQLRAMTASFQDQLNDPATQEKITALMDNDKLSYQNAVEKVLGRAPNSIKGMQLEALMVVGGKMQIPAEALMHAPSDRAMGEYAKAVAVQRRKEEEFRQKNKHLRLTRPERMLKFMTQGDNDANRMTMTEVLGLSAGSVEAATGAQAAFLERAHAMSIETLRGFDAEQMKDFLQGATPEQAAQVRKLATSKTEHMATLAAQSVVQKEAAASSTSGVQTMKITFDNAELKLKINDVEHIATLSGDGTGTGVV